MSDREADDLRPSVMARGQVADASRESDAHVVRVMSG